MARKIVERQVSGDTIPIAEIDDGFRNFICDVNYCYLPWFFSGFNDSRNKNNWLVCIFHFIICDLLFVKSLVSCILDTYIFMTIMYFKRFIHCPSSVNAGSWIANKKETNVSWRGLIFQGKLAQKLQNTKNKGGQQCFVTSD